MFLAMKNEGGRRERRYAVGIMIVVVSVLAFSRSRPASPASWRSSGDVVIHDETLPPAHLIFACDGNTNELKTLFTPELREELRQVDAGVALSTDDLSSNRAELVRQLNAAGIPTVASITLDAAHGGYVNADNAAATAARFAEFDKWTTDNRLRWEAVGLDIEPSLKDWAAISGSRLRLAGIILRGLLESNDGIYYARRTYTDLIRRMQARGYYVQTYQLPLIVNERRAHSKALERILGLVDVRGNQEVLMLYTSFNPGLGAAIILRYGPDAQAIAIGSTAGTADPKGRFSPLTWDEFSRDLIVAHHFSTTVGVYSLEGCLAHGYISRLKTMDWDRSVFIPQTDIRKAARIQKVVYSALWLSRFWLYFAALLFLLAAWLVRAMVHWLKEKRALHALPKKV